jgi:type I restriction enzyme S subunit
MKHLFTYGPVSVSESENIELEETEAGKFPKNWEKKYLEEIMEFSRKPTGLKLDKKEKIPFIPMDSIPPNKTKLNWHEKEFGEISTGTYVEKGDLIIGKITPCFENGKQSLLNDLPTDFGYATTEVWAVHPKEKALDPEILDEYLRLPGIRSELAQKMEGATGRQRLPKHVLKNILLPVPSSDEQKEMKKIISSIDQKIEAEQAKKEALDNLFQSALQQLMTGQLQVDHLKEAV